MVRTGLASQNIHSDPSSESVFHSVIENALFAFSMARENSIDDDSLSVFVHIYLQLAREFIVKVTS
jgi:hypothetical protein